MLYRLYGMTGLGAGGGGGGGDAATAASEVEVSFLVAAPFDDLIFLAAVFSSDVFLSSSCDGLFEIIISSRFLED